jgi:Flp pilus assembly protein TadG
MRLPRRILRRLTPIARDERGAAAVEFALVLPILVVLAFGIIDFGRLLYTYNNLTSAVREGARFAAVQTEANVDDVALVQGRVSDYIASFGGDSVATSQIEVTLDASPPATRFITVRIDAYEFVPITPIAALIGLGDITLSPRAVFRWERASN